jgi:hypothetical protein
MAMTKTTEITSFYLRKSALAGNEWIVQATYIDAWDDPEDDDLPLQKTRNVDYRRTETDKDGNVTVIDHSSEAQIVQDICAAIWPPVVEAEPEPAPVEEPAE